jgi:hypothetical protein
MLSPRGEAAYRGPWMRDKKRKQGLSRMRYFFDLKGDTGFVDRSGVDLPDDNAAAEHAQCLAADLITNREKIARHWRIHIRDECDRLVAVVRLLAYDRTLQHLSPRSKKTIEAISEHRYALNDALHAARLTRRKSQALIARSRGKPHLIRDQGEAV